MGKENESGFSILPNFLIPYYLFLIPYFVSLNLPPNSMDCTPEYLPYEQTGFFSKIIIDYLKGDEALEAFYAHPVSIDGIKAAIEERKKYPTDRKLLVARLKEHYAGMAFYENLAANIECLNSENTFTITTAHQPNIFTGHLYFVYKILHAVKLAARIL